MVNSLLSVAAGAYCWRLVPMPGFGFLSLPHSAWPEESSRQVFSVTLRDLSRGVEVLESQARDNRTSFRQAHMDTTHKQSRFWLVSVTHVGAASSASTSYCYPGSAHLLFPSACYLLDQCCAPRRGKIPAQTASEVAPRWAPHRRCQYHCLHGPRRSSPACLTPPRPSHRCAGLH